MKDYLEASKDAFLNSFISFSNSNDALRARVPAALLPFSICNAASDIKASFNSLILAIKTVQIKFFFGIKSPIHLFFYDFSTVDPRLQGISIHNRQY